MSAFSLPHLATRFFEVPIAIHEQKFDVIMGAIGTRIGVQVSTAQIEAAASAAAKSRKPFTATGGTAVIDITGTLVKRSMGGEMDALSGVTSYPQIAAEFQSAIADPAIGSVVLNIDSPGGECAGCFELADAIYAARGKKPITAIVSGDAFSAAYALASSADQILVNRMSGTGSIGVIAKHIDQSGADAQKGLKYTSITAGAHKNDLDSHAPLSDAGLQTLQSEVDRVYGTMFVPTVARNRGMSEKSVRDTEAALYFGDAGIKAGLADGTGSLEEFLSRPNGQGLSLPGATAAGISPKKESKMDETQIAAALAAAKDESYKAGFSQGQAEGQAAFQANVTEVIELCAVAGTPEAALEFVKTGAKAPEVRKGLLAAQVQSADALKITSAVLPNSSTGAPAMKPEESPIVKEAIRLAALKGGK